MKNLRVVRRVHRAARDVVALVEQAAAAAGLTAAEIDVLGAVAEQAPCPVGAIAGETGYRPSTLTSILDRLVARGWVGRALSRDDRRSFVVDLTPQGRRAARQLESRLAALERAARRELPREELEAFAALPERLGSPEKPARA
jgi:MarR family transcriptional regulator, organic hydroperoxide resistance regulator